MNQITCTCNSSPQNCPLHGGLTGGGIGGITGIPNTCYPGWPQPAPEPTCCACCCKCRCHKSTITWKSTP